MRRAVLALVLCCSFVADLPAGPNDGNRLTYLDECNPYYVHRDFPKLITPQWVSEPGVEAVVVLAIDDMRDPEKYEAYLRPILDRLKQIDGRAPVSIMTCSVDPKLPRLQQWLKEGLSLEIHTVDHPCPLLKDGDFAKAKSTYDRCIDLLYQVPGNMPVAFRMPCCDSLNTVSPRFYAEIFNKGTPEGNHLYIDSSVFNVFTSADRSIPRELVLDPDGKEKFKKYLPMDRTFVNTIEDYPYPYVINRTCWEFPCVTPSDWLAQHRQKPFNPDTVRDLKAAIDITVLKQGVYNLVFHPHGWIRNDQVVELIDHAVARHGKKVKFLTFTEANALLSRNLLSGGVLNGLQKQTHLMDVNCDGYVDVVEVNSHQVESRVWSADTREWSNAQSPRLPAPAQGRTLSQPRFAILSPQGRASVLLRRGLMPIGFRYGDAGWEVDPMLTALPALPSLPPIDLPSKDDEGLRFRDLDSDGICELILSKDSQQTIWRWDSKNRHWSALAFALPRDANHLAALRFVDLDEDGRDDILFSTHDRFGAYLFTSIEEGWSRQLVSAKRGDPDAKIHLPPFVRPDGTNNGAWFHSKHLFVQNEDTADRAKDLVERVAFADMLRDVQPGPKSPEASLKCMQVRPGFTVELVAAEPLVMDPVAFAWGPDGKFWVVEMTDYPLGIDGNGKHGGRVRFLEDTDGDGKYDQSTLFLDGLGYPNGVWPWRKGVLISCSPEIFYAEDTDGDGRADRREPLFVGFGEGNQQHRANGFSYGLDNWLYGANGDSGGGIRAVGQATADQTININGRDFRIRPDQGLIDAVAGQSQFGRHRDDWGNWFGNNNSNPMWHYALEDRYVRRNPHAAPPDSRVPVSVVPGASPVFPISRTLERFNDFNKANRFTSACSAIVYRDDLFGPDFENNTFVSEPVHNLVHREVMTAKGTTFSSRRADDEQQSEFLASTDNWFRPTMIQTGPDGALWIADMYRHVIEHPQWIPKDWQARLDLRAGHDKGRIYRVFPQIGKRSEAPLGEQTHAAPQRATRVIPRLEQLDIAGLVAAIDSPTGWQRDMAQQLVQRNDRSAVPLLEKLAADSPRALARLHALCSLEGMQALHTNIVARGLGDSHPGVRRHAIRLAEQGGELFRNDAVAGAMMALADDPDPQVQMQLAYTLGEWNDPRASRALAQMLLRASDDRFLRAAAISSINSKNIEAVMITALEAKPGEPPTELLKTLLGLAASYKSEPALLRALDAIATPRDGKYAAWQMAALPGLLMTLDRQRTSLSDLHQEAGGALRQSVAKVAALLQFARKQVADAKAPEAERMLAVLLLGREPHTRKQDIEALGKLLTPQTSGALQAAIVEAMGRLASEAEVAPILLAGWPSHGPELRGRILDVLMARDATLPALLTALEQGPVRAADIDAARRQALLVRVKRDNRAQAEKLLAGPSDANRQKVIMQYQSALQLSGDIQRGQAVFQKSCAACHRLGEVGNAVGPDLSALTDRSPQSMLVAIFDPNRAVEAKFLNYAVTTTDGRTLTGMLLAETGNSVTLVGQEGKEIALLRTEIDEMAGTGKSLMPEGVEKELPPAAAADLLAFLAAQEPPRKTFAGSKPEIIRPTYDGSLRMLATNCEIYGRTLVLEEKYRNLGYWQSENDAAVWSIEVAQPGAYNVSLDYACDDSSAGNTFVIEVGPQRLTGKVASTGSWDAYKGMKPGKIDVPAGSHRVVFRSQGAIQGALLDLREIKLLPAKQ